MIAPMTRMHTDTAERQVRASYPIVDHTERFVAPHDMTFSPDGSRRVVLTLPVTGSARGLNDGTPQSLLRLRERDRGV